MERSRRAIQIATACPPGRRSSASSSSQPTAALPFIIRATTPGPWRSCLSPFSYFCSCSLRSACLRRFRASPQGEPISRPPSGSYPRRSPSCFRSGWLRSCRSLQLSSCGSWRYQRFPLASTCSSSALTRMLLLRTRRKEPISHRGRHHGIASDSVAQPLRRMVGAPGTSRKLLHPRGRRPEPRPYELATPETFPFPACAGFDMLQSFICKYRNSLYYSHQQPCCC